MKKTVACICLLLLVSFSQKAFAGELRIGAGGWFISDDDISFTSGGLVYSYANENLIWDVAGYGGGSDCMSAYGAYGCADIDFALATSLKYGKAGEQFFPYVMVGYTTMQGSVQARAYGYRSYASDTASGADAGVGIFWKFNETVGVDISVSRGFGDMESTITVATLRFKFRD